MKQPPILLKVAVLVSSLLLVGGFVSYRAGALDWLTKPSGMQPTDKFIGGSKSKVLMVPTAPNNPDAPSPAAEQPLPTYMSGSKSLIAPGILTGPTSTPPSIPTMIEVPKDPPPVTPQQPPAHTALTKANHHVWTQSALPLLSLPRASRHPFHRQALRNRQNLLPEYSFQGYRYDLVYSGYLHRPQLLISRRSVPTVGDGFSRQAGARFFRPAWFTDLCFFLGQYLLWGSLVLWALAYLNLLLNGIVPHGFRQAVASQPWWLQAVEIVLLSDLLIYWGHRLQHGVGFLWRFHAVHHSAEHLDWLAAHREHPLDTIYSLTLINLPAFLFGFPLETIIGFIVFRGIWAIYIHSNVRLPIGPLRDLLGSPEAHHWHHDRDRDTGNYANLSPLMDLLFGTYRCPDHEPEHFGLNEPTPGNYLSQLIVPMLPRKRTVTEVQPMPENAELLPGTTDLVGVGSDDVRE